MSHVIVNKKAKASRNQKNALSDGKKLSAYVYSGSIEAQKSAQANGVSITVMKNGSVFKIEPNGVQTKVERKTSSKLPVFQPLQYG